MRQYMGFCLFFLVASSIYADSQTVFSLKFFQEPVSFAVSRFWDVTQCSRKGALGELCVTWQKGLQEPEHKNQKAALYRANVAGGG